ncbi:MAG: hypothetical protein II448_03565, partial [Paludibacteraceae bacterium]|nr:hypothetical protein [Paludibacteraceae bacterium]
MRKVAKSVNFCTYVREKLCNFAQLLKNTIIMKYFVHRSNRFFSVLATVMFMLCAVTAWGDETLFDVNFKDEASETISTSSSGAAFVAKTYDGYNMSFGVKSGKDIDVTSGTGIDFKSNNCETYQCLAIPMTLTKGNVVTATITLKSSGAVKYKWVSGSLPATPSFSSPSTCSPSGQTNTLTYTPSAAGNYVLYLGRSGAGNGSQYIESIVITQVATTCTAPTALAKSSVTAKGATLTVTDAVEDASDYEFYVSTSSTAPTAESTATHTATSSKSIVITSCVANTTYYAWARSKCSSSNKSDWVALTGSTFTTSTVSADYHLTNVTKTSGATSGIGGSTFTAVFAAASGYSLPTPTVTIDGNTATSGTDYTWTAGTGTLTIPANKINGNIVITLNSAAAAPSSVAIGDNWLWFEGETMMLTATPTGGNGPITYQWYKGGKADGNAIDGATNATFSKTCAFEDAGSYYCKVTCGGTQSTW